MRNFAELFRRCTGASACSCARVTIAAPVHDCKRWHRVILTVMICLGLAVPDLSAATAKQMYAGALAREHDVRAADAHPTLKQLRSAAAAYDRVVLRYPTSGYSDNALWQSAGLHAYAYTLFEQELDRRAAASALARLQKEYPNSSLVARLDEIAKLLEPKPAPKTARKAAAAPRVPPGAIPEPAVITAKAIEE